MVLRCKVQKGERRQQHAIFLDCVSADEGNETGVIWSCETKTHSRQSNLVLLNVRRTASFEKIYASLGVSRRGKDRKELLESAKRAIHTARAATLLSTTPQSSSLKRMECPPCNRLQRTMHSRRIILESTFSLHHLSFSFVAFAATGLHGSSWKTPDSLAVDHRHWTRGRMHRMVFRKAL